MDAHPIPQNVTDFEFHIVGDMTIKQFGYLAVGVIIAYIIYVVLGSSLPLIAYPLSGVFALTGAALAFLPIGDRPLDHWLSCYIKSIFEPTQMVWIHEGQSISDEAFTNRLEIFLNSLYQQPAPEESPKNISMKKPSTAVASQTAPLTQAVATPPPPPKEVPHPQIVVPPPTITKTTLPDPSLLVGSVPTPYLPSSEELQETVELAKKAQEVQEEILESEHDLNQIKSEAATPGANPEDYVEHFEQVLNKLQSLTKQESEISHEMAVVSKDNPQPLPRISQLSSLAKKPEAPAIHITLTSTPNIVNGIVTDAHNNYLEGVIVVCHDKQGLPVRALKTNKLGQFVAATPLPNGTYILTLEKDNLSFDTVEVELENKVLPPITISARKGAIS